MSIYNRLKKIYRHPVVKAALAIVEDVPGPGTIISASRHLAEQTYDNMIAERQAAYFDELENGGEITDEMLAQEEFIHSVIVTYNASLRTFQRKKIHRFARILLKAIETDELASDKFEVFVRILNDLTETELHILKMLQECEDSVPHQLTENGEIEHDLRRANRMWPQFEEAIHQEVGLSPDLLANYLNQLNRTGLYQTFIGAFSGYAGNKDSTTPLFREFCEWVKLEAEN